MSDLGMRIKSLRIKCRWSQAELGKKIGRSASAIGSYESNTQMPPLDVAISLASVFNVSLEYLVGLEKEETISLKGLTAPQKEIVEAIINEFRKRHTAT